MLQLTLSNGHPSIPHVFVATLLVFGRRFVSEGLFQL
jgi:hypothetical protein